MNEQLLQIYEEWKLTLPQWENFYHQLSSPLLLNVTADYAAAENQKILVVGQETFGWDPDSGPYRKVESLHDFVFGECSVEALMWGYRGFCFAARQPSTRKSPFWQAFRHMTDVNARVAGMWTNLSRCDFNGGSILQAPIHFRNLMIEAQKRLLRAEIEILEPDVCLFFTGPNYDDFMREILGDIKFHTFCCGHKTRVAARVGGRGLPCRTIRTYHPAYLRRARLWDILDQIRLLIYAEI